jgi:hypothetical protein
MKVGAAVIFVGYFTVPQAAVVAAGPVAAITVAAEVLLSRRGRGLSGNNRRLRCVELEYSGQGDG